VYGLADAPETVQEQDDTVSLDEKDWRKMLLSQKIKTKNDDRVSKKRDHSEVVDNKTLLGNDAWNKDIFYPFMARKQSGWDKAMALLGDIVVAHSKVLHLIN
jgi:hypothetical protein